MQGDAVASADSDGKNVQQQLMENADAAAHTRGQRPQYRPNIFLLFDSDDHGFFLKVLLYLTHLIINQDAQIEPSILSAVSCSCHP